MSFVQDEDVVEAFATHTAEKSLAEPVSPRRPTRCPDDFYPARLSDAGERSPILVVVVVQQEARMLTERRCFAQLLGDPGVGRMARDAEVDHPARRVVDDKESKERPG